MKNKLIFTVMSLVVFTAIYFFIPNKQDNADAQDFSQKPQFFMRNFTQYTVNKTGVISHKIQGETLDLFTEKNYASIKNPIVTLNLQEKEQWVIKASHAQGFTNSLFLSGNVTAQNQQKKQSFQTPSIWLYPKKDFATTKEKVRAQSDIMISEGTGAEFLIKKNEVKLLSNTRTVYAQP